MAEQEVGSPCSASAPGREKAECKRAVKTGRLDEIPCPRLDVLADELDTIPGTSMGRLPPRD